jgi:hypothetical protein
MSNHLERLYSHLRQLYWKIKNRILGEDYYTMAIDVYGSDEQICRDILEQYERLEKSRNRWKAVAIGFIFVTVFLVSFTLSIL